MIYNSNDTSDLNSSNIHCHLSWENLPDLGKDGIIAISIWLYEDPIEGLVIFKISSTVHSCMVKTLQQSCEI